jgi:dephospho-CoA kinase
VPLDPLVRELPAAVRAVQDDLKRVLVTGTSGTGKSSVIAALAARGYAAVDADEPSYSEAVDAPEGELTGPGGGKDWVWRVDRMDALLARDDVDLLFVGGCSPNQGRFRNRFDHVVLLTAPPAVVAGRLATRTTNDFGKDAGELERALRLRAEVEPLLRRSADLELDTTAPLDEVVEAILRHVG